jgi:hypothetical protein
MPRDQADGAAIPQRLGLSTGLRENLPTRPVPYAGEATRW